MNVPEHLLMPIERFLTAQCVAHEALLSAVKNLNAQTLMVTIADCDAHLVLRPHDFGLDVLNASRCDFDADLSMSVTLKDVQALLLKQTPAVSVSGNIDGLKAYETFWTVFKNINQSVLNTALEPITAWLARCQAGVKQSREEFKQYEQTA